MRWTARHPGQTLVGTTRTVSLRAPRILRADRSRDHDAERQEPFANGDPLKTRFSAVRPVVTSTSVGRQNGGSHGAG